MKNNILIILVFFLFVSVFSCTKNEKVNSIHNVYADVQIIDLENKEMANIKSNPLEEQLKKTLETFVSYGAQGKEEQSEVYLKEREAIAERILAEKDEFIAELGSVLEADQDNLLQLVDKKHFLDKSDNPIDLVSLKPNDAYLLNRNDLSLRVPVEKALRTMAFAAKEESVTIVASSTYRSYEYQEALFERNVKELGLQEAERESARAGTSQHQLGTVVDFGSITDDFALTKAGIWLDANASRFGFSLSFPQGYEEITGYRWECWHYRYIGLKACALQEKYFQNIQQYMMEFIHLWKLYT